ncbi:MAG TPA: hypothetical protein VGC66_07760 [Pyrinomonadaceae bacterium]|jgi:hypothetical protein
MSSKGVRYLIDDQGNPVAVQLDLDEWGEIWEDMQDIMLARERADEPRITLEEFEKDLREEGLLSE